MNSNDNVSTELDDDNDDSIENNNNSNSNHGSRKRKSSLNKNETIWNTRLRELTDYKQEFGNTSVPQRDTKNKPLGRWIAHQRFQYKLSIKGKPNIITKERYESLNKLGFQWNPKKFAPTWEERRQQLVDFKVEFNHTNVTQSNTNDKPLGLWVKRQRCNYKLIEEGKPSPLTKERIVSLNKLGFRWRLNKETRKATAPIVSSVAISVLTSSSISNGPNDDSNTTSTPGNNRLFDISSTSSMPSSLDEEVEPLSVAEIGEKGIAVKGDDDCYESDDSELYLNI